MVAITFDTLAYSKKLTKAGMPKKFAEVIDDHLATKKNLLDSEKRLTHKIESVDNRVEKLGYKLTIWLGEIIAAAVLILAAIIKF